MKRPVAVCALILALSAITASGQQAEVWRFDNVNKIGGVQPTVAGSPKVINTEIGKAVHFEGNNTAGDALFLDALPLTGALDYTLELIFRPSSSGRPEQRILHLQEDGSQSRRMFEIRIHDDKWCVDTVAVNEVAGQPARSGIMLNCDAQHLFPLDRWYAIATTYDGKMLRTYVNGTLQGEVAVALLPLGKGGTSVGTRYTKRDYFTGDMFSARFTRKALAPEEFLKVPAPERAPATWSYDGASGPDHWSELDPTYSACHGRQQSPVDIRSATKADLPALHFDFNASLGKLVDNSHAIRVNYPRGTSGPSLTVGGKRFYVTQFHFHHPSEELLDGKPFAMVAHFMVEAGDGQLAGVAVMLKPGKPNPAVAQLWEHLPATGGTVQDLAELQVNPASLVPANTAYYTYTGSLTAPPCTEGVKWFVMKTPVELSPEQIAAFARLYPHNIRPVQPLNGRIVEQSR